MNYPFTPLTLTLLAPKALLPAAPACSRQVRGDLFRVSLVIQLQLDLEQIVIDIASLLILEGVVRLDLEIMTA